MKEFSIDKVSSTYEVEPLIKPYGFKGGETTRLWQVVVKLEDRDGNVAVGISVQNPLWSDAQVASIWKEDGANKLMYNLTRKALQLVNGKTYASPVDMLDKILEEVHAYGIEITGRNDLLKTFALNALVAVDNAAWLLFAKQNGITSFSDLIPKIFTAGLAYKNDKVASIPSISYATSEPDIKKLTNDGYFVFKIKIGAPGTQKEMLEKDIDRITRVHKSLGSIKTINSDSGKILYYPDANGRYESKETLNIFLDHCKKIGAYDHILLIEEPFVESYRVDVSDIDARLAADESAHTVTDARDRIEMGYTALALKPVAKTLSMTFKVAHLAHERNIPCLCADLTVSPLLMDWNKSIAARLKPLPGLKAGLLETNGHQNYLNWSKMVGYHPRGNASWNKCTNGVFALSNDFYNESAGLFLPSNHYSNLI